MDKLPPDTDIRISLAQDAIEEGREERAKHILHTLPQIPGTSPSTLWIGARLAYEAGFNTTAETLLKHIISIAPDAIAPYFDLANVYIAEKKSQQAEIVMGQCLRQARVKGSLIKQVHPYLHSQELASCITNALSTLDDNAYPDIRLFLAVYKMDWSRAYKYLTRTFDLKERHTKTIEAKQKQNHKKPCKLGTEKPHDLSIVTSLSPKDTTEQQTAIASWKNNADVIFSLNTQHEINQLRPNYPNVRFIAASRDGLEVIDRPLMYIDDLLDIAQKATTNLCGIVNADIKLLDYDKLAQELSVVGTRGITLLHRTDLENAQSTSGSLFSVGYDAFFCAPKAMRIFKNSKMLLGAPNWDYFIPMRTIQASYPLHIPEVHIIGHVEHSANWSVANLKTMWPILCEAVSHFPAKEAECSEAHQMFFAPSFAALAEKMKEIDSITPEMVSLLAIMINELTKKYATDWIATKVKRTRN